MELPVILHGWCV